MSEMMSIAEASELIKKGERLFLAGSEKSLLQLPKGKWVGGTIPYFMTREGGVITGEKIQVTTIPVDIKNVSIRSYGEDKLSTIPQNYYKNGFSLIVIPAFSTVHFAFAKECTTWNDFFNQPLVGWISGIDLSSTEQVPKIINGETGEISDNKAIVMHTELADDVVASANIINIFEQSDGDTISFPVAGFDIDQAIVNGAEVSFGKYLADNKVDLQLPLVADYMGAMINVSFRDINKEANTVRLYAPVFPGVNYKLAKPFASYEKEFESALKKQNIVNPLFSCNCILNFLYANLEGKKTGNIVSAMTFGEIAYMLLNQTFVYVSIEKNK